MFLLAKILFFVLPPKNRGMADIAAVPREAVTLGHKGADAASHHSGGARVPPGPQVGTSGLKRADTGFS